MAMKNKDKVKSAAPNEEEKEILLDNEEIRERIGYMIDNDLRPHLLEEEKNEMNPVNDAQQKEIGERSLH